MMPVLIPHAHLIFGAELIRSAHCDDIVQLNHNLTLMKLRIVRFLQRRCPTFVTV